MMLDKHDSLQERHDERKVEMMIMSILRYPVLHCVLFGVLYIWRAGKEGYHNGGGGE